MTTIFEIPLPKNNDNFKLEVELSGNVFKFDFLWNVRGEFYSLGVENALGERLINVPLNSDQVLLSRFRQQNLPQGDLFIKDVTGKQANVLRELLGDDFVFYYNDVR